MTLDSYLSKNKHIASVVSSCIGQLGQINRIKDTFDRKTFIFIPNAPIFNKMCYLSVVWPSAFQRNIEKLQGLYNFAACIVTGTRKYDHVVHVVQQLGWLPVIYTVDVKRPVNFFIDLQLIMPDEM